MTEPFDSDLRDAARTWAIRTRDPGFGDWDGFTAWLEADPAHAAAYDAAMDADEAIGDLFAIPAPIVVPSEPPARHAPRRVSRRWFGGGAVAAALALAVVLIPRGEAPYAVETAAGERRTVELAGGSQIVMNGDSRLTLDADRPRFARLDRGEALFVVEHDDADPFIVDVGEARLVDLGTVFNVAYADGATRVAVSEGVVMYNPDREAVRLEAGRALEARDGRIVTRDIAVEQVGGWRQGSLSFTAAPPALVAGDLSRALGVKVRAAPTLAPFNGTIAVDGEAAEVLPRVAPLLGAEARPTSDGWILADPNRAQP